VYAEEDPVTSKPDENLIQTAVRVPGSILTDADTIAAEINQQDSLRLTRADILRQAMTRGMEQLKAERKKR
jgi:hypothetical protein